LLRTEEDETMPVDEHARHLLHETLDELMGGERAATLMELLPPVGWADVARRSDVEGLGRELRLEMRALEEGLRAEMERQGRRLVMWNTSTILAAAGLALAVGRLL
jgi:hypothetical protein